MAGDARVMRTIWKIVAVGLIAWGFGLTPLQAQGLPQLQWVTNHIWLCDGNMGSIDTDSGYIEYKLRIAADMNNDSRK